MAESEEEVKSFLMKVKEESEKAGLKLNIQKAKTMAFGPITSWQINGETMETVTDDPQGREYLLEKEMATHSDIPAWKIPWTEEPGRLQSSVTKGQTQLSTHTHKLLLFFLIYLRDHLIQSIKN